MGSLVLPALAGVGVLAGAATQRATGLGFALVAAPFLVLVLGAKTGVGLANLLSAVLCALVLLRTWRALDWRRLAWLSVPGLAAVPAGAAVVAALPEPVLLVGVGSLAVAAMVLVRFSTRATALRGRSGAVAAGAMSGFMNVTAGLGGPMITVHALAEGWDMRRFVATAQGYLLLVNVVSVAAKGPPDIGPAGLTAATVLVLAGAVAGEWLAARVDPALVRRLMIAVAILGGLAAVLRGALMW
ncbi:sulfite exporter TauE/SafE family protein [Streptomyces armeniacus]|uniref:Probable membrane transporter protein n=1 Tax=Streptomyces armeniacus TaxID=83291 RepID=A0A345XPE0_9ACTN|nr:sulfite exporter TauE/SafE family protein [Streptomyces armeniacus]AXK33506.1 sulfite exporter TauE/SafE family protein [Streptomyces armeniacus]